MTEQGFRQSASVGAGRGYTVGMALNPTQRDEIIVCAGDKPPGEAGVDIQIWKERNCCEALYGTNLINQCRSYGIP